MSHRGGLYDAILVKENHAALAGGLEEAARLAVEGPGGAEFVEVEVEDPGEPREGCREGRRRSGAARQHGARIDLRKAVRRVKGQAAVEASGGITLDNVREVADTGVDFISVGALTHSAPALDVSLLPEPQR